MTEVLALGAWVMVGRLSKQLLLKYSFQHGSQHMWATAMVEQIEFVLHLPLLSHALVSNPRCSILRDLPEASQATAIVILCWTAADQSQSRPLEGLGSSTCWL